MITARTLCVCWLAHDPEKCATVFRKDHAQSRTESAMVIQPDLIAL
jgi:hypothetical protein